MSTTVILVAVALAMAVGVAVAVVLSRRSPAALSEEDSASRASDRPQAGPTRLSPDDDVVVERPAGPDAESMGVDDEGRPTTR